MAVSRAERRWSKEPRMVTTLSVIVWLFCSDSLILAALSLRKSSPKVAVAGTPIVGILFVFLSSAEFKFDGLEDGRKKKENGGV